MRLQDIAQREPAIATNPNTMLVDATDALTAQKASIAAQQKQLAIRKKQIAAQQAQNKNNAAQAALSDARNKT